MFKVAIVGAENRGDYKLFVNKCSSILKNKINDGIVFYSCGDRYVNLLGRATNIDVVNFNTNWKLNGKNALKVRNNDIINKCDAAIIFDDGTSDIKIFTKMVKDANKPHRVIAL